MSQIDVLYARDAISDLWHHRGIHYRDPTKIFISGERYEAFCAAKDLIQDTGEALLAHREKDFAEDPKVAYLEFWGVMQAVFIQQDAISELQFALFGERLPYRDLGGNWNDIREWRNFSTGHPARKNIGKNETARCVTGREAKSYQNINLHFHSGGPQRVFHLHLGKMLDGYETTAVELMEKQEQKLTTLLSQYE